MVDRQLRMLLGVIVGLVGIVGSRIGTIRSSGSIFASRVISTVSTIDTIGGIVIYSIPPHTSFLASSERFAENDAIIPQLLDTDEIKPTYHLYLLQIDPAKAGGDIQVLKKKLEEKGVTQIAHFGPLYRFKIVQDMGYDSDEIAKTCPNCEEVFYKRFTHLPLYGLSDEQIEYMADAVLESVAEMQRGE